MSEPLPVGSFHTPAEIQLLWAQQLRARRLRAGWRQLTLAQRAGISVATIRRFEKDGQTTLSNLLLICNALGTLDSCATLFELPIAGTLNALRAAQQPIPKRARR